MLKDILIEIDDVLEGSTIMIKNFESMKDNILKNNQLVPEHAYSESKTNPSKMLYAPSDIIKTLALKFKPYQDHYFQLIGTIANEDPYFLKESLFKFQQVIVEFIIKHKDDTPTSADFKALNSHGKLYYEMLKNHYNHSGGYGPTDYYDDIIDGTNIIITNYLRYIEKHKQYLSEISSKKLFTILLIAMDIPCFVLVIDVLQRYQQANERRKEGTTLESPTYD